MGSKQSNDAVTDPGTYSHPLSPVSMPVETGDRSPKLRAQKLRGSSVNRVQTSVLWECEGRRLHVGHRRRI